MTHTGDLLKTIKQWNICIQLKGITLCKNHFCTFIVELLDILVGIIWTLFQNELFDHFYAVIRILIPIKILSILCAIKAQKWIPAIIFHLVVIFPTVDITTGLHSYSRDYHWSPLTQWILPLVISHTVDISTGHPSHSRYYHWSPLTQ